jgi:hypothetical protein
MTDKTNCAVCFHSTSESKRSMYLKITCFKCETVFCSDCLKNFIINSSSETVKCLNVKCDAVFTSGFISQHTSATFYNNKLHEHRANNRFAALENDFPNRMDAVARLRERRRRDALIEELQVERRVLMQSVKKIDRLISDLERDPRSSRSPVSDASNEEGDKNEPRYTMQCQVPECRGFINRKGECLICSKITCLKCNVLVEKHAVSRSVSGLDEDDGHDGGISESKSGEDELTCNPDDILSFEEVKRTTKCCPKCGVRIFKISGCNHFWCTRRLDDGSECGASFDWETLTLIPLSLNTNPHYYAYLTRRNENTRNPGDVACGGIPRPRILHECMRTHNTTVNLVEISRQLNHIQMVEMRHMHQFLTDSPAMDHELSVHYLIGDISKDTFLVKLKKRIKRSDKVREIYPILDMYVNVMSDIMRRVVESSTPQRNTAMFNSLVDEMDKVRTYTNSELDKLSTTYKIACPHICTISWSYLSVRV